MRKILVIRAGGIGDTLLLLPFLKYLERQYPGVEIGLAGKPERMRLLASQLKAACVYDLDSDLAWLFVQDASVPEREGEMLRSQDWIIRFAARPGDVFDENLRRLGCPRLSSIPALPPADYERHAAFYPFDALGTPCSIETLSKRLSEWTIKDRHTFAPLERDSSGVWPGSSRAVVFFPGAGSPEKRWPLEHWERLLEGVLQRTAEFVVILAGPAEEGDELERLGKNREERVALARGLPLSDLPDLLIRAKAYIGSDCGITHLAALMGVPTLALFTSTDPGRWGPLGRRSWVFRGAALYRYPQWIEGAGKSSSTELSALAPEGVLAWLESVLASAAGESLDPGGTAGLQ